MKRYVPLCSPKRSSSSSSIKSIKSITSAAETLSTSSPPFASAFAGSSNAELLISVAPESENSPIFLT